MHALDSLGWIPDDGHDGVVWVVGERKEGVCLGGECGAASRCHALAQEPCVRRRIINSRAYPGAWNIC